MDDNDGCARSPDSRRGITDIPALIRKPGKRWWAGYVTYLLRMLVLHPTFLLKRFATWNRYLFFTTSVRPLLPPQPALASTEVDRAAEFFNQYGFVVLPGALSRKQAEDLREIVRRKAAEVVRLHQSGQLQVNTERGKSRYSFDDVDHCPEWEFLAHNEVALAVVRAIWKGRAFRAVCAGGDFVLPGGTWQPLHSDERWMTAGDQVAAMITANYYISDVSPDCGPLRQIAGTQRFPLPHRVMAEPSWMKECVITGTAGTLILRDSRAWHGGTPNTSSNPRFMLNLSYVLRDDGARLGCDVAMRRLKNRQWIAEFD